MKHWTHILEGTGPNPNDAKEAIKRTVDDLRSKGHDITAARFSQSESPSEDLTRQYAGTNSGSSSGSSR